MNEEVLAAGGVVVRGAPGAREVVLVHRPRYDDWTHPKGKLHPGNPSKTRRVREVLEETGWRCALGPELPHVTYTDAAGRPKRVRFWVMFPEQDDAFASGDEVDEIRWLPADEAARLLSYPRDVETLDAALALDEPLYLVRHAKAGSRRDWRGERRRSTDHRQGTSAGGSSARAPSTGPGSVWSCRVRRCAVCRRWADGRRARSAGGDPRGAPRGGRILPLTLAFARALAGPAVACTHGNIVEALVLEAASVRPLSGSYGWKKGSTWILERDAGRPVGARYVPPPRDRVG